MNRVMKWIALSVITSKIDEELVNPSNELKEYCEKLSDGTENHYDEIAKIIGVSAAELEGFVDSYSDMYKEVNSHRPSFDIITDACGGRYTSFESLADKEENERDNFYKLNDKVKDTMEKIIEKYLPEVTKDMKEDDDFGYICNKAANEELGLDDLLRKFPDEDENTLYDIYNAAWSEKGEYLDRVKNKE